MDEQPPDVSEKELEVLQALWDLGPSPIRPLAERVYRSAEASEYAAVQKFLERLEKKGYVTRDRSVTPHLFSARVSRDDYIGRRLRDMADRLCGGSLTPLLTHLLQTERLSDRERRELRRLLNESERPPATGANDE